MANERPSKTINTNDSSETVSTFSPELVNEFVRTSVGYYQSGFEQISRGGWRANRINPAALVFGPIWSAGRGLWIWFWVIGAIEIGCLINVGKALFPVEADVEKLWITPVLILLSVRLGFSWIANSLYLSRFTQWRVNRSIATGMNMISVATAFCLSAVIYAVTLYRFLSPNVVGYLETFPADKWIRTGSAEAIDEVVIWLVVHFEALFDSITFGVRSILNFLESVFVGTPWPVSGFLFVLIAWRVASPRVAIFTAASLAYIAIFGYWDKAMSTVSLIGASVFICLIFGVPLGIWCAKNPKIYSFIRPNLDVMQTMPAFVYLIPAVAFFSVGKPPGVLATVIFAMPPMIRLTALGISQVPESVKEAAIAFGASPLQLLFKVEIPLSIPSVMTGINQTIMMSLSMVVIAALIGAGGLGHDIMFALNHVETGKGILAGIAIALCAMVLDRVVQGSRKVDE